MTNQQNLNEKYGDMFVPIIIPKLISIDFDGTLVRHAYPEIGEWLPHAERVTKRLQDAKHRLILNTCREDEKKRKYLTEAVEHCKNYGISFVSVNENAPEDEFRESKGRKVYAHYYIDDRNVCVGLSPHTVDWLLIEQWAEENGLLLPRSDK